MPNRPNILFLMTDQMQAQVLDPNHPCQTPNLDRLAARGLRFTRAYTSNAICSPARAGIMTGLLPHNHGVLTVTHLVDDDQCNLRTEYPHWAQRLAAAGYRTGYFGKWHVERTGQLERFGWQTHACELTPDYQPIRHEAVQRTHHANFSLLHRYDTPGYQPSIFYGVCDLPPAHQPMGLDCAQANGFLDEALTGDDPWCCFASVSEPHDPFICSQAAFDLYDVDAIDLPPNTHDELADRPGLYRKAAKVWRSMTDRQRREAATCYYASITDIDQQFGRLIDTLDAAGQLDNTIVVITSDHGELLGAHGLYCKNISASEEVYNIPLILAGPGIAQGTTTARVGSHDLCPTLLDLLDLDPIDHPDSRSFAPVLADPGTHEPDFTTGYAEYFGGRFWLTQRIAWAGPWKFVLNGFDEDELYNLDDDPYEMTNRIDDPDCADRVQAMTKLTWQRIRDTNDHSLLNTQYPILRLAPVGPGALED